jgi:hypothetical protein
LSQGWLPSAAHLCERWAGIRLQKKVVGHLVRKNKRARVGGHLVRTNKEPVELSYEKTVTLPFHLN